METFARLYARWIVFVLIPAHMFWFNHVAWPATVVWRRFCDEWARPVAILLKVMLKGYLRANKRRYCILMLRRYNRMRHHLIRVKTAKLRREVWQKTAWLQEALGTRINPL